MRFEENSVDQSHKDLKLHGDFEACTVDQWMDDDLWTMKKYRKLQKERVITIIHSQNQTYNLRNTRRTVTCDSVFW